MEQYLELIRKKKEYVQKLIQEYHQLSEVLKLEDKKKSDSDYKIAMLYVRLNQYQYINQENSIVTYSALISILLFVFSVFGLYTVVQMGFNVFFAFLSFFIFNFVQGTISLLAFKITKKYFKDKRKKNENNIQAILDELNQLRKIKFIQDKEYNDLYQKLQKIKENIYKEEQDIDFISRKIIDVLLNAEIKPMITVEDLDFLIEQEINKSEQTLIDTDLKRKLK